MKFGENFGLTFMVHVVIAVAIWIGVGYALSGLFFHEAYQVDQWDIIAPILIVLFVDGLGLYVNFGGKKNKKDSNDDGEDES